MARGINKVILVGNLGNDPESRYTQAGAAITNITVATSESWKDKNTGQAQERTEWHRVVFFNKLAEIAGQYLRKGSKVYIEGALRTRKWQDQQGQDRYTTEIVANEMQMLDSRGAGNPVGAPPAQVTAQQGGSAAGMAGGVAAGMAQNNNPHPYNGGQAPQSGFSSAPQQAASQPTNYGNAQQSGMAPQGQNAAAATSQGFANNAPAQQPAHQPAQQPAQQPATPAGSDFGAFDDDIPF